MCGIATLISKQPEATAPGILTMLRAMQHRGPDGAGIAVGHEVRRAESVQALETEGLFGALGVGHTRLAIVGGTSASGLQPFQSRDDRLLLLHNGEIWNHHELRAALTAEGIACEGTSDSEVVMRLLERAYDGDLEAAMAAVVTQLDGVYALAATDGRSVVVARDPIGIRQLYLAGSDSQVAVASERKALAALDLGRGERIEPGTMVVLTPEQVTRRRFREVVPDLPVRYHDLDEATSAYGAAIERAVGKRLRDRERVGVVFSGGIDSLLIARLTQNAGKRFACYTAGVAGSSDLRKSREAARVLDLPLVTWELSLEDIRRLLPEIMHATEERSFLQLEVAIPVFAAVRRAAEAGERVLLTGQGADELFGGYPWYRTIVEREGYAAFAARAREDIALLYKETLEREDKITMAHSIELRVPYLDPEVVAVALAMAPELKIRDGDDKVTKWPHRRLSLARGVPEELALRPKEAAQHGSGVHGALDKLARQAAFTPEWVASTGFSADHSGREVLGSSVRYGHKYSDAAAWRSPAHVQLYLDALALEAGLLEAHEADYVRKHLARRELNRPQGRTASCV